ncbi:MAG: hypothetical protein Q8M16_16360 [Pirellulaceae bacterium]|nr:hypothetical protein [Pirellulaceae bacterium]
MFLHPARRYRRLWLPFFRLMIAGTVGWMLSSHWLHGQDLVTEMPSRRVPTVPSVCLGDHDLASASFWRPPFASNHSADTTFRITKTPFRYGDFGAVSYPQRYQVTNYYRSRTDWVWQ